MLKLNNFNNFGEKIARYSFEDTCTTNLSKFEFPSNIMVVYFNIFSSFMKHWVGYNLIIIEEEVGSSPLTNTFLGRLSNHNM